MKRLLIKLFLAFCAFLAVNLWFMGRAAAKGAVTWLISQAFEETAFFILLQVLVAVIGLIRPLRSAKQKAIYWCAAESLVLLTVLFWGFLIVGPIWLK